MTEGFGHRRFLAPRHDASHAIRVPRVRILPSASFRSHLTMGTLAVRLGVPVIKASKGLAPSSHFPVGFRLPVDSARQGAARHAWRTSGRREGYPSRPPTPPCVRFRTRRFKCSAADPGVESEGSGVPTPQASDCSRPHACARPPRSTRRLARWRWPCAHAQPRVPVRPFGLHTFQGCSQVLSPQHLLQQRLGLWSDRVRARRCRLTHESRLMATSGRRLPGSLGRLSSHDCASVGTRDHGIGLGSLVRASGRCDDPSALC